MYGSRIPFGRRGPSGRRQSLGGSRRDITRLDFSCEWKFSQSPNGFARQFNVAWVGLLRGSMALTTFGLDMSTYDIYVTCAVA
jgi:hypothetical protein